MKREDLEEAVLEAQLKKNSCKMLTDGKGNVKSVETKAYAENNLDAVTMSFEMQVKAMDLISEHKDFKTPEK